MPKNKTKKRHRLKTDQEFTDSIRGLANFAKAHVETMRRRKVKRKDRQQLLSLINFELKSIVDLTEKLEKQLAKDEAVLID